MNTKTTAAKSIAQTVADQARAKMTTAQMIDTIALIDARNADEDGDMSIRAALFIALADTLGEVVYTADDEAFDTDRDFATVLREMMAA